MNEAVKTSNGDSQVASVNWNISNNRNTVHIIYIDTTHAFHSNTKKHSKPFKHNPFLPRFSLGTPKLLKMILSSPASSASPSSSS